MARALGLGWQRFAALSALFGGSAQPTEPGSRDIDAIGQLATPIGDPCLSRLRADMSA
jgi:hypothetical protein